MTGEYMNNSQQDGAVSALACVALNIRPPIRFYSIALAKRLKSQYGSTVHAYCDSDLTAKFLGSHNAAGLFASITVERVLTDSAKATGLDEEAVVATAKAFEKKLDLTYNFLAVANRQLGRGYVLAGFYHPRSRYTENVDYIQMLHAYNEALSFWEREISEKGITIIVNGGREAACITRLKGIPFRTLILSRIENLHYWAHDEYYETPAFKAAFDALPPDARRRLDEPYTTHMASRAAFMKSTNLVASLKLLYRVSRNHLYWRVTGHPKGRGYFWSSQMASVLRRWWGVRALDRMASTKLADLEGERYVYYPLHLEPEAALHWISPEYFFQLSTIAALSRDLPAGVLLVVKEAFSNIGRRPANFYQQIADMKNVVLLETMEIGFNVVRQAEAVATICGTTGLEAAAMGKPVITFGKHNNYNILPHVQVVTELDKLASYLSDALSGKLDADAAKADTERLLQAIVECSFDMRQYDYVNIQDFAPESVEDGVRALAESVQGGAQLSVAS
jgi:hypothetical protein